MKERLSNTLAALKGLRYGLVMLFWMLFDGADLVKVAALSKSRPDYLNSFILLAIYSMEDGGKSRQATKQFMENIEEASAW